MRAACSVLVHALCSLHAALRLTALLAARSVPRAVHGYRWGEDGWETSKHQFALDGRHGGRIDARGGEDNISTTLLDPLALTNIPS